MRYVGIVFKGDEKTENRGLERERNLPDLFVNSVNSTVEPQTILPSASELMIIMFLLLPRVGCFFFFK